MNDFFNNNIPLIFISLVILILIVIMIAYYYDYKRDKKDFKDALKNFFIKSIFLIIAFIIYYKIKFLIIRYFNL